MVMLTTDWRAPIYRFCNLGLLAVWLPGIVFSPTTLAVNQDQLWLPRDYYRYFRQLNQAAEISEQRERCAYVIAGTLSQERSTKKHPVFVITCRDRERQTFAYIVDGLSLEILNLPPPPNPEEVAKQELQLKLEKKWLACYQQLKKRTDGLRGTNLTQDMPEANMNDEDDVNFTVDFNATSMAGDSLHFRAHCQYQGEHKETEIHPQINKPEGERSEISVAVEPTS